MDARISGAEPPYIGESHASNRLPIPPGFRKLGFAKDIYGVLQELGVDADLIIGEAGFQPEFFRNGDNLLPVTMLRELLLHCVRRTNCAHFAILVGQKATLDSLSLLGPAMRACGNLETALRTLEKHHRLLDRGAVIGLEVDDGVAMVNYSPYGPGGQGAWVVAEAWLASMAQFMRDLCGPNWVPAEVLIPRRPPKKTEPYSAFFSAPVRFNQEIAALVFPASWLQASLAGADEDAHRALEPCILQLEQSCPADFADDLRRLLRTRLVKRRYFAADAAKCFSVHRRTLSRHLKAASTGFRAVSDEVKFGVAQQLVGDTDMRLTQISAVLDFSEPAAFTRAFERWSGVTPSAWRSMQKAESLL